MYYIYLYMYIPFIEDLDHLPQETLRTSVESCHNSPVIDLVSLVTVGCGWCCIVCVYAGGSDSGGDGSGGCGSSSSSSSFSFEPSDRPTNALLSRARCRSLLVSDPSSSHGCHAFADGFATQWLVLSLFFYHLPEVVWRLLQSGPKNQL